MTKKTTRPYFCIASALMIFIGSKKVICYFICSLSYTHTPIMPIAIHLCMCTFILHCIYLLLDAFALQIQLSHGEIPNMPQNWHSAFKSLADALTYGNRVTGDFNLFSLGFVCQCCGLSLLTMLVSFRDHICNVQRNMQFNTLNSK